MCSSTQSKSHLNPIQVSGFVFPLHPGSHIYVSSLSQLNVIQSGSWYFHLAYIQVTSHLHRGPPNCILVPSKHHLKCIHVSRCVSHLHPGPLQLEKCNSAPSQSHITPSTSQDVHLNSIQVPSQPHPGLEICVYSPPRLSDTRLFFVSVESYLNLGPDIYISPPSRLHLTSIQVHQIAS